MIQKHSEKLFFPVRTRNGQSNPKIINTGEDQTVVVVASDLAVAHLKLSMPSSVPSLCEHPSGSA